MAKKADKKTKGEQKLNITVKSGREAVEKAVPKPRTLHDSVEEDSRHFNAIYKTHQEQLNKSIRRRAYTEAYLLAWTMVEQVLLPSLFRYTLHRAGFKEPFSIKDKQVASIINYYYLLSQDLILYKALCRANKDRVGIIHGFKTTEDIISINQKAKVATRYLLENVTVEILNRLVSKTPIPVLTLYSKGWNDCRSETLKKLEALRYS